MPVHNVRFLSLNSALQALQLMGFATVAEVIAAGYQLREVRHGESQPAAPR